MEGCRKRRQKNLHLIAIHLDVQDNPFGSFFFFSLSSSPTCVCVVVVVVVVRTVTLELFLNPLHYSLPNCTAVIQFTLGGFHAHLESTAEALISTLLARSRSRPRRVVVLVVDRRVAPHEQFFPRERLSRFALQF